MAAARPARYIVALAIALLAAYVVVWTHVDRLDIGRSDFTSTFVGATLLREGHRSDLYSDPLQAALHTQLIAPDREGNLPFVDAPVAAALAAPVTLLSLDAAYRLWGLLQVALLAVAVLVALRSAPWPRATPPAWKVAAVLAALAGAGTLALLLQAQWTSVSALGLALAYREWRRDRLDRGAALLTLSAGIAKPHLALALIAFTLGWRTRRLLAGVLLGAAAAVLLNLALVGPSGIQGFVHALTSSATRWDLATFVSFVGLPGAVLGNGMTAEVVGAAGSVLACGIAAWLGSRVRRDRSSLEPALAGAALLSLLAAPHALLHDLALVAPVLVWMVAWSAPRVAAALVAYALITAAALASVAGGALAVAGGGALAPGETVAPALMVSAALAVAAVVRTRRTERGVRVLGSARLAGIS